MRVYQLNGFQIREYEEVGSTNTLASTLPWNETMDKTVVLTYRQTQGKGQVGNHWESEPGRNISMTVMLKPRDVCAGEQFAVSMVIALGVFDFISRYVNGCAVKWPNDVYTGEKKIAGILIEHTVMGSHVAMSLCGIGVNINQARFLSDAPNPVSLVQLTGRELPLEKALGELLEDIGRRYGQVNDYAGLKRDFLRVLYRRNGVHRWEDKSGVFDASIEGIDEFGRLVLKDLTDRKRVYGFKEVKYL